MKQVTRICIDALDRGYAPVFTYNGVEPDAVEEIYYQMLCEIGEVRMGWSVPGRSARDGR